MNEFDYDSMQKKKLCASARKCKNGSKSRKCSLPSDHLTAAQLRAKNGPVQEWDMNEPMSWDAFKAMPADLQAEYVRWLNSRFCVGVSTIGQDLFGKSISALGQHLRTHGIAVYIAAKRLSRAERDVWEHWLNRTDGEEAVEEELVSVCAEDEQEVVEESAPAVTETPAFGMSSLCAEWCGEFNALAFMAQLSRLPMPEGRVKIRLEVEKA